MQITLSCPICKNLDLSKPYKFLPQNRMSVDCRYCGLSFFVEELMMDTQRPTPTTKSILPNKPGVF